MSEHDRENLPARSDDEAPRPAYASHEPRSYEGNGHVADDEIELRELLGVLVRRKWMVLAFVAAAVAGTGLLIHFEEPTYRAQALVRMEDTQRAMAGGLDQAARERLGGGSAVDPLRSQLQVLTSAQVLGQTVDQVGLRLAPIDNGLFLSQLQDIQVDASVPPDTLALEFGAEGVSVQGGAGTAEAAYGEPLELAGVRFTVPRHPGVDQALLQVRHRQRAVDRLRDDLQARPREETDVVEVEYTSRDPELVHQVVNAAVEAFRERNVQTARQDAERRRVFLEEQMDQADSLLSDAQRTLSDFRSRERVYSSQEWFAAQQEGLMNLEVRREELDADRGMYRSILDGLQEAEPGEMSSRLESLVASPEIAENPVVAGLFDQLVRYEASRDSLVSGPWGASRDNPDVRSLEEQIMSTRDRLEGTVRSHMGSVDARIEALDDLMGRTSAQIAELPEVEAEEARLVQRVRSMENTVDQLREEFQRARISEAVEAGQVDVIDLASAPLEPEGAGRALKLTLGLMLGLMLGGGAAFLAETLNTRIRQREDMESTLQVASLGVVPRLPINGGSGAFAGAGGRVRGLIGGKGNGAGSSVNGSMGELVTVSDAQSPHAEAFRTIRTNLLFSESVRSLRTLVCTSPTPAEGKTTTTANLAVAYAQQGVRVLLVDCDLRKSRVHKLFGFPREPGLTDLVLGKASWEECCREISVEGMDVLGAGTHPPNPSELLGGARMRKALDAFRERYDMVLLDTPPLIAGPDAAILGSLCDGVLLVVRAGQTEREAGQQAVRQLHTVGARVLGAVLNDPDGELPKYSSYYSYQYKYYSEGD